ncbi:MAG: hypothetical protein R3E45_01545, partial [Rhodocyclaceae bacterium]
MSADGLAVDRSPARHARAHQTSRQLDFGAAGSVARLAGLAPHTFPPTMNRYPLWKNILIGL